MAMEPVNMNRAAFVDWAVQAFGVDEDDVSFWDMARDLDSTKKMPLDFEVSANGTIPAALYDVLQARKAVRPASIRVPFKSTPDRSEWEDRDGRPE